MVSIAALSDCHLGYRHRFRADRLRDYLASFTDAVRKIMQLDPDIVIIGGDLLHQPKPDPVSMRSAVEKLLYLADHHPVVMAIGNHEIQGHLGTTYTPIYSSLHRNIHVLSTENPLVEFSLADKVRIHGFQYLRGKKHAEKELGKAAARAGPGVNILLIHQAIEGYLEPHELSMRALREAGDKFDLILSGHVHKHQRIGELETPAYYIGSTERVSFNEAENSTGFMYFRRVGEKPEFIPVESSPMMRIRLTGKAESLEEFSKEVRSLIESNLGVDMLKIDAEVDLPGDRIEFRHGFDDYLDRFKILEVDVNLAGDEEDFELENLVLNEELIREYFSKANVDDELYVDKCVELFEKYQDG